MKTVNVVLVSYFSEHEIENLIKSLLPESLASEKYELFFTVVSNGGDCSNLAFDTHIKVIQTGYNAGFAHGCNLGADSRETDLVLFCNPDIVIDPLC
jgi:GT2 family glycosyltransferase